MKLEKFITHTWPEGTPHHFLIWYPESEPNGVVWGPCATEFIRDDIARRILARDKALRKYEETGIITLPDAYYTHEKGLTNYR